MDIEKGEVDESIPEGMTVEEIRKRTFNLEISLAESPLSFSCCIFKVPEVLRRQKEKAYKPDIVSIGPFHRGADEKLHLMENVKKWYLKCLFLPQRQGQRSTALSLDSLTEGIKVKELDKLARACYSDPCHHLDQDDFIEMLILDGCFLIELFRKATSQNTRQDNDDPIFNVSCMLEYLYHDLLLLENQLPWFVLQYFYDLFESGSSKLLREVVIEFFKDSVADINIFSTREPNPRFEILHILDLIRTSLIQDHEAGEKNILDSSGANYLPQKIHSVTALSDVGVKFKKAKESCILNITFKNGVFTIPPLAVDERTGTLFSNLMAYELCYHSCAHKIISYAILMNCLIDTKNDADLLCEEEIVVSFDNIDASKFFNDLTNDTTVIDFIYKGLDVEVNNYLKVPLNRIPWKKWRKELIRYFIAYFAAFVLLVLTFLQTAYTVQQYYHSPN